MKKVMGIVLGLGLALSANGSFMYQEIDPICSISGKTHTSFPWEISDTSSWEIPVAYQGECDAIQEVSDFEKRRIYQTMVEYFEEKGFFDGGDYADTLNDLGKEFIKDDFFPAVQSYITGQRTNSENIAILHYAVSIIGYDYYLISPYLNISYVGLSEQAAIDLANDNDVPFRIGGRDGEIYFLTEDYVIGRITAIIQDGIVVSYTEE